MVTNNNMFIIIINHLFKAGINEACYLNVFIFSSLIFESSCKAVLRALAKVYPKILAATTLFYIPVYPGNGVPSGTNCLIIYYVEPSILDHHRIYELLHQQSLSVVRNHPSN